eukprot:TRINITY_DN2580_c0_g1_i2.p2 TRINITY_DN2580_c0_g1~~TRINITY_DN2580_c0_g1_i2.p2  ORF type:complete len:102 (-),score=17.93 TRINITY_DN2580_c0_g1_i2:343-648(-)
MFMKRFQMNACFLWIVLTSLFLFFLIVMWDKKNARERELEQRLSSLQILHQIKQQEYDKLLSQLTEDESVEERQKETVQTPRRREKLSRVGNCKNVLAITF